MLALREIEKEKLVAKFQDPRVVLAVSCAAVSCPDRAPEIFAGPKLEAQLEALVRTLFENPAKGLKVDRAQRRVTLSWILKADRQLFGGGEKADLLRFVRRYVDDDLASFLGGNGTDNSENNDQAKRNPLVLDFFEHDWGLNDLALVGTAAP